MKSHHGNISHPPYWRGSKRLALPHVGEDVGHKEYLSYYLKTIWHYLEVVGVHLMT